MMQLREFWGKWIAHRWSKRERGYYLMGLGGGTMLGVALAGLFDDWQIGKSIALVVGSLLLFAGIRILDRHE